MVCRSECAPVVSLGRLHVELDIEQFAAGYVADCHNRRMLQFSFRRDREEAAMNLFGATNPAQAVLFQLSFKIKALGKCRCRPVRRPGAERNLQILPRYPV